jgi:hypothetical protein
MEQREDETIKFSARIPKKLNTQAIKCANSIGISKNDVLILALKNYIKKEEV